MQSRKPKLDAKQKAKNGSVRCNHEQRHNVLASGVVHGSIVLSPHNIWAMLAKKISFGLAWALTKRDMT